MDNDITAYIPPMLADSELDRALQVLPPLPETASQAPVPQRLVSLSDLYDVYIPNAMTREIYNKIYLALLRSLHKKQTKLSVLQAYENHKTITGGQGMGIIGGTDSFSVIGASGIGKSSAINRVISVITDNKLIEIPAPYTRIIPVLSVQCPFDCSVKGMVTDIIRQVDLILGTEYLRKSQRTRATTDMLIGSVANVCMNHIGLLVIDEIQNVVAHKQGKTLIAALMQIINSSGISICMVGTPECNPFFEGAYQLARRSVGLEYGPMKYGEEFFEFCRILLRYQYTLSQVPAPDSLIHWLYEHSDGNASVVVSLLHDAQELAITTGAPYIDIGILSTAYKNRMGRLQRYITPKKVSLPPPKTVTEPVPEEIAPADSDFAIRQEKLRTILQAKCETSKVYAELSKLVSVTLIPIPNNRAEAKP